MVLVDTSAWIFALRKNPFMLIKNRIDHLLKLDVISTIGMIRLEILGGAKTKDEFDRLKSRLESLYEISTDTKLWESASLLAFDLQRKGLTVPYTDILIASAAIKSKATLLHADEHFDLISEKTELKVESYVSKIQKDF
ncbi:MAG: PIN domain nuclease [Actinobacteria bacterium]|nr:PIN domain nuclease [Actinomycetota bacterium]